MRKQRLTVHFMVLLLVFATTLFTSACERFWYRGIPGEPGGAPIIENQRNYEVRIYVTLVRTDGTLDEQVRNYGNVPAKSVKELASITFTNKKHVFRIEAKDPSGQVVFSHDYNMDDLEKIGWKIVITDNSTP